MESSVPFNEFQKLMGDDIEKKTTEEPKIIELDDEENEEVKENEEKKVQFKDPIKEEKIIENNEEQAELQEEEKPQEEKPPEKGSCKLVSSDNVAELVNLLQNEAKVI